MMNRMVCGQEVEKKKARKYCAECAKKMKALKAAESKQRKKEQRKIKKLADGKTDWNAVVREAEKYGSYGKMVAATEKRTPCKPRKKTLEIVVGSEKADKNCPCTGCRRADDGCICDAYRYYMAKKWKRIQKRLAGVIG